MKRSWALVFAGALALSGCSGDDGGAGPQGAPGPTGPQGPQGPSGEQIVTTEQCAGCHGGSLGAKHASTNQVTVSNETVVTPGAADANLAVTFNVKVDGVNRNDFTRVAGAHYWTYDAAAGYGTRNTVATSAVTVTQTWNGNYSVTLVGYGPGGATPAAAGSMLMIRLDNGNSSPQAAVVAQYGDAAAYDVVSNDACINCHGQNVFRGALHHSANPKGVRACVVCHDRNNVESRLGDYNATTNPTGTGAGTRLMGYVHGIHNSHNMPDGVYSRSGSTDADDQFSIGFPGYMNNCATCHDSPERLAIVNAAPVSWATCFSCHDDWDGFSATVAGAPRDFHRTMTLAAQATPTTACSACHVGKTVADMHNGLKTPRNGLIWDGADQSVVLGPTVQMAITGVSVVPAAGTTPAQLSITWTATQGGTAVNPCNTDLAAGPLFFGATANTATGQAASNLSILRAYAQGNDWVNEGVGSAPGQPGSAANVTAANTTCAANVATTVIPAEATTATRGTVALQGKPQIRFAPAAGTAFEVIQVRSPSPTREFVVADGSAPSVTRRQIVSIEKCNACHSGSMYQHGGNRVDSIDLCVMCHNPAANEKNNRFTMGVDENEAYDRRTGETYDLRYMIHAIHSAGESGQPLVYYRTNGIYFFGTKEALANVENWPGTGCQTVAGSTAPAGNDCRTSPDGSAQKNHNFVEVHYPRALNDCAACHVDGSETVMPDPTQSVAVTVDAGAAPWGVQLDDVLLGPSAATCMSCHQSGDHVEQFGLRVHAYGQGWVPATFDGGRQTLIDAVQ